MGPSLGRQESLLESRGLHHSPTLFCGEFTTYSKIITHVTVQLCVGKMARWANWVVVQQYPVWTLISIASFLQIHL